MKERYIAPDDEIRWEHEKWGGKVCPACGQEPLPLDVVLSYVGKRGRIGRRKEGDRRPPLTMDFVMSHRKHMAGREIWAVHGIHYTRISKFEKEHGLQGLFNKRPVAVRHD